MHNVVDKLISIKKEINEISNQENDSNNGPIIIAVSKTFPIKHILPLINYSHIHFGENKVQEELEKWSNIKNDFPDIKLHMIGKLQTNKVKQALPLFDFIHSLDSVKLAQKISTEQIKYKKKPKIFIQINIGQELQKNGINADELVNFYKKCINDLNLNIIGLMCLPPRDGDSKNYFLEMSNLVKKINLKDLSIGMSGDYITATKSGATYLRIGSKIFGDRF